MLSKKKALFYLICVPGIIVLACGQSQAQFGKFLQKIIPGGSEELTDAKIAAGLKEMLRSSVENTAKIVGQKNGYMDNSVVKITMPEKLRGVEKTLRALGMGQKIDAFIVSMNKAAEQTVPPAKKILLNAISRMSIEDARGILKGGDTAATEYFKAQSYGQLLEALQPVINKKIAECGVTAKYQGVIEKYKNMPFAAALFNSVNIDSFVVKKTLDGLFQMLAQQERQIRTDPASRVNGLLRQVIKQ